MTRNCGCCGEYGHFNQKNNPCPNEKTILEEKERKRIEKEEKKRLQPTKAGGTVKTRVTSTRHGFVVSLSINGPPITIEDLDHRNKQIWYRSGHLCQYCRKRPATCKDHIYACVNQKTSCYGLTNVLSELPSCFFCNSDKRGMPIEEWIKILQTEKFPWTENEIKDFHKWLIDNKSKLILSDEMVQFAEKQFLEINRVHEILEHCAQTHEDVNTYITFTKALPTSN